jgi:hypothetical protein
MRTADIQIWDASRAEDAWEWASLWERWPRREVFAHPYYVRLFGGAESQALCASIETDEGNVIYPFIVRDLTTETFWPGGLPAATDLITPYGYGGPFAWGAGDAQRLADVFWEAFDAWAAGRNVVSEFVRLTLFAGEVLPYPGEQYERSWNVVRALDLGEEELWMDFESKVRKNVKKARRADVRIEIDPHGDRLDDFHRLYTNTMERRGASAHYYFPRAFFETIHRDLPGLFIYFHGIHQGEVISTELVLVSAERVYSFLGGTDRAAFDLCPNDLLKYEIIRWAQHQKKRAFVLGGGYQSEDGIYRYKLAFAPRGRTPFITGQRILRPDLYQWLVDHRRAQAQTRGEAWSPRPGFFPAYRA